MNEIDLFKHGDVTPGLFPGADQKVASVLHSKLAPSVVREAMLEGKRYTAHEAHSQGIIDMVSSVAASSSEGLVPAAVALAARLATKAVPQNRATVALLKYELVREAVEALRAPGPRRKAAL